MKKLFIGIFLVLAALTPLRADNLQIGDVFGCLQRNKPGVTVQLTAPFSLPGASGNGTFSSMENPDYPNLYTYNLDLSGIQGGNHCVRLVIYFGTPESCNGNQIEAIPDPTPVPVLSATEAFSSITVKFGSVSAPCLVQGEQGEGFAMLSDQEPKLGFVTVIDDYVDAGTGLTNEAKIKVPAYVPDIPPLGYSPLPPWFQGVLFKPDVGTNQTSPLPLAPSGTYNVGMQLYNAPSNGLAIGPLITQSVTVSNGLFNAPMNFDPSVFFGGQRWLSLSVQPPGSNTFTVLNPPLPVSPTPQATYAYTAGGVADLAPGQAVTSLNGLTDPVNLQAGSGIVLGTNGNTLIVNTIPGAISDRNLKTDFGAINPAEVLARLAALPVQSWRYTNELAQVRHIGPMAQDFMQTFRLGDNDRIIGYVDENGVALAAIQGLNQKIEAEQAEKTELKARLDKLENLISNQKQP